ncbi:hypothetical protein HRbin39_01567 [bacterium HR39]|nr:hypothetical protein HRbin39_01567 [bacterium HR39]
MAPSCDCIELRAPVDGAVLAVPRREAGPVQAGEPLLVVGDPRDVELVLEIASEEAVGIRPGAPATVSGWGGPAFAARVRRVEPFARTVVNALGIEEQRTRVVLDPVELPADLAGEGYRVRVAVERARIGDALRVPDGALVRTPAGWAVFVVGGGRARRRPVEVVLRGREMVAVAGDLVAGERVVLWPGDLGDGAPVRAREAVLDRDGAAE